MKIAIIFTCYNRMFLTKRCIEKLLSQQTNEIELKFYICDDGSTDGTSEMIKEILPDAVVVPGGNLFWSRGMYIAMKVATEDRNDYYMMVNDDVDFYPDAVSTMLKSYEEAAELCGIVGSAHSLEPIKTTYGGRIFIKRIKIGKTSLLNPNGALQKCDIANWNCFMIPGEVIEKVGLIDNNYEHGSGDFDYSLMMKHHGFNIFVANKYIGRCNLNSEKGTYLDNSLVKRERLKKMISTKGRPLKGSIHFYHKHYGLFGLVYLTYIYVKEIGRILLS